MHGRGAVGRGCGLGQDFSELGRVRRGQDGDAGTHLGLAVGGVLGVHARVEGDAVEAGRLREGGEGTGQTREGDEVVVATGSHWVMGWEIAESGRYL